MASNRTSARAVISSRRAREPFGHSPHRGLRHSAWEVASFLLRRAPRIEGAGDWVQTLVGAWVPGRHTAPFPQPLSTEFRPKETLAIAATPISGSWRRRRRRSEYSSSSCECAASVLLMRRRYVRVLQERAHRVLMTTITRGSRLGNCRAPLGRAKPNAGRRVSTCKPVAQEALRAGKARAAKMTAEERSEAARRAAAARWIRSRQE